jgi:hypothetical protein
MNVALEAELQEEPDVPTPTPRPERVLSDRFIGSHVVAPVSMLSPLQHVLALC